MSYQYSQEAKERISKLGQSEIVNFINEISPTLRRKAFGCLPKVPGFRAGHPTEIKEKQKKLGSVLDKKIAAPRLFSVTLQTSTLRYTGSPGMTGIQN